MSDDVVRLLRHVRCFQRQARRVAFARALGVAAGLALAAAAVWILTVRPEPTTLRWSILGAAALGGMLVAALVAWLRTPSLQRTGSAIDRGLKLEDRVVAALHLHRTPDVVATLVISDAVRTLQGTSPEQVFPLRVGWWVTPAAIGAGLVVAAMALDPALPAPTSLANGSGGSGSATRAARPGQDEAPAERSGAAAKSNAEPQPAFAPDGASVSAPRASADQSAGKPAAAEAPNAPSAPAVAPDGAMAGKPAPSAGSIAPVRDSAGAAASTTSTADARAAGDAESPGAPRAGGVGGAPTPERTNEPLARSPRSASSPPAMAAARAQAEAAIRRGEIPPGFRKYVRDYFTAIQRSTPAK